MLIDWWFHRRLNITQVDSDKWMYPAKLPWRNKSRERKRKMSKEGGGGGGGVTGEIRLYSSVTVSAGLINRQDGSVMR